MLVSRLTQYTHWFTGSKAKRALRLTDSQPMVRFSRPHSRDKFCTQLAHIFSRLADFTGLIVQM